MSDGSFSPAARAAIMGRTDGRCVACGQPATNIQHRRARGMGGTRAVAVGHPANGLPLCGSGTTGCHGWTEANPDHALAFGWRLTVDQEPTATPYYSAIPPWQWNRVDGDGLVHYVDASELPWGQEEQAHDALMALRDDIRRRAG